MYGESSGDYWSNGVTATAASELALHAYTSKIDASVSQRRVACIDLT